MNPYVSAFNEDSLAPLRLVEVPPDSAAFTPWFGPMGPNDVLDHAFDFSAWLAMAPEDALVAVTGGWSWPAGGISWSGLGTFSGSIATLRVSPAGQLPVGTMIELSCAVLTLQGRSKTATGLLMIAPTA